MDATSNTGKLNQDVFNVKRALTIEERFLFDWADFNNDARIDITDVAEAASHYNRVTFYWDLSFYEG